MVNSLFGQLYKTILPGQYHQYQFLRLKMILGNNRRNVCVQVGPQTGSSSVADCTEASADEYRCEPKPGTDSDAVHRVGARGAQPLPWRDNAGTRQSASRRRGCQVSLLSAQTSSQTKADH